MKKTSWLCVLGCLSCLGAGCQAPPSQPRIAYQTGAAVGQWNVGAGGAGDVTGMGTGTGNGSGTTGSSTGNGSDTTGSFAGQGSVDTGNSSTTGGGSGIGGGSFAGSDGSFGGGGTSGSAAIGGGSAGTTGGAAGSVATSGGTLTFDVLTHSQNGRYAPRNIGAIWIETSSGQFVKTLEIWAFIRRVYLSKWNADSGGSTIDAVSSATLSNHKTHHVTWNMLDSAGNPVPDGAYKVMIEVTDYDGAGKSTSVDFTKGAGPMTVTPPDQQYYTGMQLVVQ